MNHPDLFILGLLPMSGGAIYLLRPTWIRAINTQVRDRYNPGRWIPEDAPNWLLRILGVALLFIAAMLMWAAWRP